MSSEEAVSINFPPPTIQEFARAYKLDEEGIQFIKEVADQCAINKEFKLSRETTWEPVAQLERDARRAFFSELANLSLPNIARAYHYFSSGHHIDSIYASMLVHIQTLPQFSRYLREHEEGIRFVETQISLLDDSLFNIAPDMFSAAESISWLKSSQRRTCLLHWSICHYPPTYSLALASPDLRNRALSLLSRVSTFCNDLSVIARLHPKEDLSDVTRMMKVFERDLYPFLKGHGTAQKVRGFHTFTVWWKCSGMDQGGECEKVKDEDMLQCGKCRSVRYCSQRHQRADWKNGHKLVCYAPTW